MDIPLANETTRAARRGQTALRQAVVAASIALLPLAFQPLRFDGHESYRAGLLLLLAATGLMTGGWRERLRMGSRLLVGVTALWCLALVTSALLSLSPARSLFGDTLRHMGLWTQLALTAGLLFGAGVSLRQTWPWFWLGGVAVALFVLMQAAGLMADAGQRAAGPMGFATATGGWLALAIIWAGVGLVYEADRPTGQRLALAAGLVVMVAALVVTGARAGLLAMAAGAVTLLLLHTAARRKRALALAILLLIGVGAGGYGLLASADPDKTPGALRTVAARAQAVSNDPGLDFRQTVWANSLSIVSDWPTLAPIGGGSDRWAALRPLVGYGAEMFEAVHRPLIPDGLYIPGQRIDRAHNDWLDTLIAAGWLGACGRVLLFAAVWIVGLRRLRLYRPTALLLPAAGALAAGLLAVTQANAWLPLAVTLGGLVGGWLWLAMAAFLSRTGTTDGPLEARALVALGVLVCHVVDLQFGFETVAAGWAFWLAMGLLAGKVERGADDDARQPPAPWVWAGLAGALALRSGLLMGTPLAAGGLFVALLGCAAGLWARPRLRDLLALLALPALGGLAALATDAAGAALMDVALFGVGLALVSGADLRTRSMLSRDRADSNGQQRVQWSRRLPAALVIRGLLLFWACDTAAQVWLREGQTRPPDARQLQIAAGFAPWDDRIAAATGAATFAGWQRQFEASGQPDPAALEAAAALLDRAIRLNSYDADHALAWANVEANLALVAADPAPHLARAEAFFAAATALWPTEETLWTTWGRFTLDVGGDAPEALALARQAVCLRPLSMAAIKLLRQAGAAAGLPPYVDCETPA